MQKTLLVWDTPKPGFLKGPPLNRSPVSKEREGNYNVTPKFERNTGLWEYFIILNLTFSFQTRLIATASKGRMALQNVCLVIFNCNNQQPCFTILLQVTKQILMIVNSINNNNNESPQPTNVPQPTLMIRASSEQTFSWAASLYANLTDLDYTFIYIWHIHVCQ